MSDRGHRDSLSFAACPAEPIDRNKVQWMNASLRASSDDSSSPGCLCGAHDSDDDHRLDVRVADAERAVAAAQHRLHLLRKREDSNAREHNSRRLHSLLPANLLLQVIRYVVAENPRAAPKLAAICTSFRDIVHASPDLWQRIHITHHDPDPAEIARVYVARSAGRPFSVTLRLFAAEDLNTRGSEDAERDIATLHERLSEARDVLGRRSHPAPDEWPPLLEAALQELQAYKARATAAAAWDASLARAMRVLFAEFHRCIRFEFRSTRRRPTELVADHIQAADAPTLRELILHLDPSSRLPAVSPRRAPALSLVDIQGAVADPLPRLSGLSQLRIVNGTFDAPATPLAPLLGLLRANPDLEELCLQPLIPHPVPLPSAPLSRLPLPRLKRLHLIHNARVERLMNHIQVPALTELTLAVQPGCHSAPLRSIFQGASYPALQTLRLVNLYIRSPTSDIALSLRQLSTLRGLYISESTLCESVLSTLADPEYCPLLEELVFDRCDGIAHDAIEDIWRARAARAVSRGPNGQARLGTGAGAGRLRDTDVRRSNNNSNSAEIQLNGSSRGALRSLVVRNSSAPLADMELGESSVRVHA